MTSLILVKLSSVYSSTVNIEDVINKLSVANLRAVVAAVVSDNTWQDGFLLIAPSI